MKRYLCWLAMLGIVAIPDWASACWPIWGPPVYRAPLYVPPPIYTDPGYPTIYIYPPVFQPAPGFAPPTARMESIPKMAVPYPASPATVFPGKSGGMESATSPPSPVLTQETGADRTKPTSVPPKIETIRPVGGNDTVTAPAIAPKKWDVPIVVPDPLSPTPMLPTVDSPGGLPPLVLPKEMEPPSTPGIETPKKPLSPATPSPVPVDPYSAVPSTAPKNSSPTLTLPGAAPSAVPSAAPGSFDPLIPPPSVPLIPNSNKPDSLPSLTLPPDVPIAPTVKPDNISRSSPLTGMGTGGMTMKVFPVVVAEKVGGGYRTVGFFNHTSRDLNLTIEGRTVKLPAKTYLEAKLAQTFTWSYGDRPAAPEHVPDGAAGLDVVFRE